MKFEKVSRETFYKSITDMYDSITREEVDTIYDNIKLPTRSTSGSCGYDFYTPVYFYTGGRYGEVTIPTGIKVCLDDNKFLAIFPRSGFGFKYGLRLMNTVGIIDSDYYNNNNNEGHIMIKFDSKYDASFVEGDRIAQGIIMSYYKTEDDDPTSRERNGGMGSTGK